MFGEDVAGPKGGVFKVTEGLAQQFGEERIFNTPLAEASIVGVGIGAAMAGYCPVVEIQFADFIYPAVDQIINEAAKVRYRSNNGFGCCLTIRVPYGGGIHGALYHSQCPEAMFAQVPGLKVVVPGTPADAKGLLKSAIRDPDPVLFFEHKKLYRSLREPIGDLSRCPPIGRARVVRPGDRLSLFAYGYYLQVALRAAEAVARTDGQQVEVVDLRSLVPRPRGDPGLGRADEPGHGRLRGEPLVRPGRRGRGLHRRGVLRAPRRAGRARRLAGRAGDAVQQPARGGLPPLGRAPGRGDREAARVLTDVGRRSPDGRRPSGGASTGGTRAAA